MKIAVCAADITSISNHMSWAHNPYLSNVIWASILLSIYLFERGRIQRRAHEQLISSMSLLSHLTNSTPQLFGVRGLEHFLPPVVSRGNKCGRPITFLHLYFSTPGNTRGTSEGISDSDLLTILSELLLKNFRGSDTVLRMQGLSFLVVLPDTSVQQARFALGRLDLKVDEWNLLAQPGQEILCLHCCTAWVPGNDVKTLVTEICQTTDTFKACAEFCGA
jgi:hypothetical protein